MIEDRPVRYGGYAPENFDLTFQGTVTVRRALQMSLNVPAVAVLDKVGVSRFTARLGHARGALALPQVPPVYWRAGGCRGAGPAPAPRSGGGLVCGKCTPGHPAPRQCGGRPH